MFMISTPGEGCPPTTNLCHRPVSSYYKCIHGLSGKRIYKLKSQRSIGNVNTSSIIKSDFVYTLSIHVVEANLTCATYSRATSPPLRTKRLFVERIIFTFLHTPWWWWDVLKQKSKLYSSEIDQWPLSKGL